MNTNIMNHDPQPIAIQNIDSECPLDGASSLEFNVQFFLGKKSDSFLQLL